MLAVVSETRTSYLVGRADRILRGELEQLLAPGRLTLNEATALSVLADRPGLSNAHLARRSLVSAQAMHKVMRSLESEGLVVRASSPSGGRSLEATLTEAGRSALAEANARIAAAERAFLEPLDPKESHLFRELLLKITGLNHDGEDR